LASLTSATAGDPQAEIFTGLDASNNAVSGYLGGCHAFDKGLYDQGWRIRAVGSPGCYYYPGRCSTMAPICQQPSMEMRATALRFLAASSAPKPYREVVRRRRGRRSKYQPARFQQFGAGERRRAQA
jgi:hypothetical protein